MTHAVDDQGRVRVQSVSVNFLVTGDKKHQTGIYCYVYAADGTRLAEGSVPGSDNQSDFWPAGETHAIQLHDDVDFPVERLRGSRLHIDSGNPDEWHTRIEATASLSDGSIREVLPLTGEVGFNWDGQNGSPTFDANLAAGESVRLADLFVRGESRAEARELA